MKRIYLLLAVLSMVFSAMAQNTGILLSYNKGKGGLKFFRSNELMKAIEAAEVNDTLYFTSGSFDFSQLPQINDNYYAREWTKPLVVIGAGAQEENGTIFSHPDRLYIKFDESIPQSQRNISFEGVYIYNWICPGSEINNITLKNFRGSFTDSNELIANVDNEEDWVKPHTYIHDILIEESWMYDLVLNEGNVDNIMVFDSKLRNVHGSCSEKEGKVPVFDHCRINYLHDDFSGLVQNSAIFYDYASADTQINASGLYYSSENSDRDDRRVTLNSFKWDGDGELSALDGSVYLEDGSMMGTYPSFTLFPSYPTLDVNNSEIDYDSINKNITITVKMLGDN